MLLTPWPGGPTLKPSASTESTKSGPPPPGCIIKDLWVDDHHHDDDHQIYKCLNFFVSQPILDPLHICTHDRYGNGACSDGARFFNFDVGWQWEGSKINTFFAIATMVFDRFVSNLVDTWAWYNRIVSFEKKRHHVTTSRRYDIKTSILAFFSQL